MMKSPPSSKGSNQRMPPRLQKRQMKKAIPPVLFIFMGCIALLNTMIVVLPSYYLGDPAGGSQRGDFAQHPDALGTASQTNNLDTKRITRPYGVHDVAGDNVLLQKFQERLKLQEANDRPAAQQQQQQHRQNGVNVETNGKQHGGDTAKVTSDQHGNERISQSKHIAGPNAGSSTADITTTTGGSSSSSDVKYHVIFSTGCSIFQDWQSYVFFYHILQSGQLGDVTRIVSGCKKKEEVQIQQVFDDEYAVMAPDRFHLHLTPDFSRVHGKPFKYYNKPFGVRHWMEHALGYPDNHEEHDNTIVILLDPDQILLRPFTNDFSNATEMWRKKRMDKDIPRPTKVEHGSAFTQSYGFNLQWKDKVNITKILLELGRDPVSNLDTMSRNYAWDYFMAAGPPYIATAKDMYAIVESWSDFVPYVHDQYPHLLAEMFGYNIAAAHLDIKHTVANSFMVSDVFTGPEGWELVRSVPPEQQCEGYPFEKLPHVIHYCQSYYIGKWFINKYRLRKDFISCEAPLLKQPPADVAVRYNYGLKPDRKRKKYTKAQPSQMAFMACGLIRALNQAAVYYKDHHCDPKTANYEYSYVFHDNMEDEEFDDDDTVTKNVTADTKK